MSNWTNIFEGAPQRSVPCGAVLFRQDDPVTAMYMVASGSIALERPLPDGVPLTLHLASAGQPIAEASLFANAYHCDAAARADAKVAVLPRTAVLSALRQSPDMALSLIEMQSRMVQAQRTRIEILRLRRVADRLDAWLALFGAPPKGGWINVADQIGVSPPALYRELAKRRT